VLCLPVPCGADCERPGQVCVSRADAKSPSGGGHKSEASQDAGCDVLWHGRLCLIPLIDWISDTLSQGHTIICRAW